MSKRFDPGISKRGLQVPFLEARVDTVYENKREERNEVV